MNQKIPIRVTCEKCENVLPKVIEKTKSKGSKNTTTSIEIECPICQSLLTVNLPFTISNDTNTFRGDLKI